MDKNTSLQKFCIYFSANVSFTHRQELSDLFGFQLTPNLGKYLSVLLLHEKRKSSYFQFILDHMTHRFNSRKSHFLSLVGRVTLAEFALTTITSYIMQTIKLPNIVCVKIDHICRHFIWG